MVDRQPTPRVFLGDVNACSSARYFVEDLMGGLHRKIKKCVLISKVEFSPPTARVARAEHWLTGQISNRRLWPSMLKYTQVFLIMKSVTGGKDATRRIWTRLLHDNCDAHHGSLAPSGEHPLKLALVGPPRWSLSRICRVDASGGAEPPQAECRGSAGRCWQRATRGGAFVREFSIITYFKRSPLDRGGRKKSPAIPRLVAGFPLVPRHDASAPGEPSLLAKQSR
jgi:hypothetical protein